MKTTKKLLLLAIEKDLARHENTRPKNPFKKIFWRMAHNSLITDYQTALKNAGYTSIQERENELKQEQSKWEQLFSNHPVEQLPYTGTSTR